MMKSGAYRGGTQKSIRFSLRLTGVTETRASNQTDLPADTTRGENPALPEETVGSTDTTRISSPEPDSQPSERENSNNRGKPSSGGKHSAGVPESFPPQDSDSVKPQFPPVVGSSKPAETSLPTSIPKLHEEMGDALVGTTVDSRYVIESRIARGGMATVYRARDTRLDRPVALKIMYPHLAESQDFVARFRREARAAAKLTHPGVVAVYDQGTTEGSSYLVMELVQGPNLRTYLRSQGCLSVKDALTITKQIFQALAAAHRSGLVHRDVKPENVLIPENGPVKVADFGLARAASEATAATTGSILGTVAYLAPETVSGDPADGRVDVYATGIMLYELLSGVPPFTGDSPIQIAYAHVHDDTPRIREAEPWVPESVDDLIAKLTERDPAKRPLDGEAAGTLVDEVLANLSEEELSLRGTAEPTLDDSSDLAGVMVTPTLSEVPLPEAKKRKPKASSPASSRRNLLIGIIAAVVAILMLFGLWFFLWGPGSYRPMVDVTNQQWASASKTLTSSEIDFERIDVFHDTVAVGNVARTDPAPGKPLGRFQKAKIYVSKGIEMLQMPDLTGKTKDEAPALVTKARFDQPQLSEEFSDTVPAGQVAAQDPAPGASVPHNTVVKVTISKGREPVTVPEVSGKMRDEAAAILTQSGLSPEVSEDFSDTVPKGAVISQSIKAGTTAFRNDKVGIVVSKGPQTVTMPNVVGKRVSEARATLEGLGLVVKVDQVYAIAGIVAESRPKAGTQVKVGSTVTIRTI